MSTKHIEKPNNRENNFPELIGITACPTGIAHTYMAKEKLEQAAQKLGLTYKIETQGRSGIENSLSSKDIANAKYIIFAADKKILHQERFNGLQVLEISTKEAIFKAEEIIQDYKNNEKKLSTIHFTKDTKSNNIDLSLKNFRFVTRNLLSGVSYMLPFVVAGGIILGIGFLLDSGNAGENFGFNRSIAAWFSGLGKLIFSMMIPILGGYICYAIVGIQGLLPGVICGLAANAPESLYKVYDNTSKNPWGRFFPKELSSFNSGFFGAIAGAYLAAFVVFFLSRAFYRTPKSLRGVKDIVFIPVLSALAAGLIMFGINIPLGYLNYGLGQALKKIAELRLSFLAGLIVGLMMSADMGGPINKAAYFFGLATLNTQDKAYDSLRSTNGGTIFMAASMLAGMVPPLAIAMSTRIFHRYWAKRDVEGGNTNWLLSACFITEGAIPFAAADPKRVIPCCAIGSGITGGILAAFGVTLSAPHGGVFVFPLLGIQDNGTNWFKMPTQAGSIGIAISIAFAALFIGAIISALLLGFWRKYDIKNNKLALEY